MSMVFCGVAISTFGQPISTPDGLQIRQLIQNYELDLNKYDAQLGADVRMIQLYFLGKNSRIEYDLIPENRTSVLNAGVMTTPIKDYLAAFKSAGCELHFTIGTIPTEYCLGTSEVLVSLTRTLKMRKMGVYNLPIKMRVRLESGRWGIVWMGFTKDAPNAVSCAVAPPPPPPLVCPPCPVADCMKDTKCQKEFTRLSTDRDNWKTRFEQLMIQHRRLQEDSTSLKTEVDTIKEFLKVARAKNDTLQGLLTAIREEIVATVETMQLQKSTFVQQAAVLKAEYDGFAETEKKLREQKPQDAAKRVALAKLEKEHTDRALDMWKLMYSIGALKDNTDRLLTTVYEWSLPYAKAPSMRRKGISIDLLPKPKQIFKSLQAAEPSCDDANQLQLDIMTEYSKEVIDYMGYSPSEADNRSTSLSFLFISRLLMSNSATTLSHIKASISNGLLEDVVLQGYKSEGINQLTIANNNYNKGNYLDALRSYVDYEKAIRRLDPELKATVKYNYATILLWNLGDFTQTKGLFKGKMQFKILQRVDNATRYLNELALLADSNLELIVSPKVSPSKNTSILSKGDKSLIESKEKPTPNEPKTLTPLQKIGLKARVALAKYGTRNQRN